MSGTDALALQGKATVQASSLDGAYGSTTAAQKTGNLQYPIHLHATQTSMLVEGKQVPLVPGMLVNVEIETERLRAIDYVLDPIEALFSTAGTRALSAVMTAGCALAQFGPSR